MLSNKNIIVTGCQHEIGRGAVVAAALNGANVFACTYRETEEYREFCERTADDANVEVIPVYLDGTDDESIRRAVKIIEKTDMDIHGLINAGEISSDVPFGIISSSDMEEVFRVNVFSQILFTQHISRLMLNKHTEGSIAFVSNISGLDGNLEYGGVTFAASKAAVIGAMRSIANELGGNKIRVNAVCPGAIETSMPNAASNELKHSIIGKMDIKRFGTVSEVADTLVFLMSDYSSHMTGQTIRIDGGMR